MKSNSAMAIILAAGKGTRMKSDLPKVLIPVCGRPMIRYVCDALAGAGIDRIVLVVGHRSDLVREEFAGADGIELVEQSEQLGTGHAVMMCREQLKGHEGPVIVVTGDSPMLQQSSIAALLDVSAETQCACALGTVRADDARGWGRIVRDDDGRFVGIVEEKDASDEQRQIQEVNASTYLFDAQSLLWALDQLTNDNAQQEYYITDCPSILLGAGRRVEALNVLQPCEALGINTPADLAAVEAELTRMSSAAGA